jgi:hypothetical protein
MISRAELRKACDKAIMMIEAAGIQLTEEDKTKMTAADFESMDHLISRSIRSISSIIALPL